MFLIDLRKDISLNFSALDFSNAHTDDNSQTIKIPLHDLAAHNDALPLAYDIASRQAWYWPDIEKTTVSLEVDFSRSYLRLSLLVGTQPGECETATAEVTQEWLEFETVRAAAVQEHIKHGGGEVSDTYPVMLTDKELADIRTELFTRFSIY